MSQNNAIKWSRAVQPYMGGSYGLILAAFISGKESLRLDGYKRTGGDAAVSLAVAEGADYRQVIFVCNTQMGLTTKLVESTKTQQESCHHPRSVVCPNNSAGAVMPAP